MIKIITMYILKTSYLFIKKSKQIQIYIIINATT
jgi:hypothetical protein